MADNTINYNLIRPSADDFYNIQDFNNNMTIIDTELKDLDVGKAPSGHGLGTIPQPYTRTEFKSIMQYGSGFYQVDLADDSPTTSPTWKAMVQLATNSKTGLESGGQLLMSIDEIVNPRIWYRNMIEGAAGKWVEMLHTGNIGKYANARIATGTYQGANSKTKTLTGIPFVANLILIFEGNNTSPTAKYKLAIVNGVSQTIPLWETDGQRCDVTWDGKVPTWSSSASNATSAYAIAMNSSGSTYYWFAFGKGEGA